MASGGRFGTAQSTFQVGGNTGTAIGPYIGRADYCAFRTARRGMVDCICFTCDLGAVRCQPLEHQSQ